MQCSYINQTDKQCKLPARWELLTAPDGTAHPARAMVRLCARHYGMLRRGTLDAVYIEVGPSTRLHEVYYEPQYMVEGR